MEAMGEDAETMSPPPASKMGGISRVEIAF